VSSIQDDLAQEEVTVARAEKLKLGKGAAFVKTRLKRLRQEDDTWEADFRALPKPILHTETHYLGLVVTLPGGSVLADTQVEGRPSVNDLATLLAHAMRRPLTGKAHRPRSVHVRGRHQWRELFPHLEELGIAVSVRVREDLPTLIKAYGAILRERKKARSRGMAKPTSEQANEAKAFPAIARWVREYGWVEIGQQELFGFVAGALNEGGTVFEDDRPGTLAEAMAALEKGLAQWFKGEGVELELVAPWGDEPGPATNGRHNTVR
jgi:hypothetical protein